MKLAVVWSLWVQAHTVLPAQALAGSPSETLLMWLMKKEMELANCSSTLFTLIATIENMYIELFTIQYMSCAWVK